MQKLKSLPSELRKKKIWINGLLEDRGKLKAKTPCNEKGIQVSVKLKNNLKTYLIALKNTRNDTGLGLGIVFFFKSTDKKHLTGIDLDFDPANKELSKRAYEICKASGSYFERSLNGGFHILGYTIDADKIGRKGKLRGNGGVIKFEIYNNSRYFLCTGRRMKAANKECGRIDALVSTLLGKLPKDEDPAANNSSHSSSSPQMEDKELISLISGGSQALAFSLLHEKGDLKEYNGDHSAAVMAWHNIVAFYTQDYKQVTRLFHSCGLSVGKWAKALNGRGGKWERVNRDKPTRKGQHAKIVKELKNVYTRASLDKYVKLLCSLGEVRRDLFLNEACVYHEGQWKNIFDDHIINEIKHLVQMRGKEYKTTEIVPALTAYMHTLKPELLIDIPKWDGRDRIKERVSYLNPKDPLITHVHLEEIFKHECGQMFAKLYNPYIQTRCILLQGGEGIGKDVFIEALYGGLGPYLSTVTINRNMSEKDFGETIGRSAVVWISEFDRVRQIGAGTIRDIQAKPFFDFRNAFGKVSRRVWNRATWVGSLNPDQPYVTAGANRRYLLIRLAGGRGVAIKWDYERSTEYSLQLLAQMKHLCETGYKASEETEEVFKQINETCAPEDTTDMILEAFDDAIEEKTKEAGKKFGLYNFNDIAQDLARIARMFQLPTPNILQLLKATGRQYRHKTDGRFYGLENHCSDMGLKMRRARRNFIDTLKQGSKLVNIKIKKDTKNTLIE